MCHVFSLFCIIYVSADMEVIQNEVVFMLNKCILYFKQKILKNQI